MKRLVSWCGFALIAGLFLVRLPLSWAGVIIAALVVFLFAPRE